jgi:hypothetical protein
MTASLGFARQEHMSSGLAVWKPYLDAECAVKFAYSEISLSAMQLTGAGPAAGPRSADHSDRSALPARARVRSRARACWRDQVRDRIRVRTADAARPKVRTAAPNRSPVVSAGISSHNC